MTESNLDNIEKALKLCAAFIMFHIKDGSCVDINNKIYSVKDCGEKYRKALNDIASIRSSVDVKELEDALDTYEVAFEDDAINNSHLNKYNRQTHHSLALGTEILLGLLKANTKG